MDPLLAKVIAAGCGSFMTAITMTPFDVVKTRLQTQPPELGLGKFSPSSQVCCLPSNTSCVRKMSSLARAAHPQDLVCLWDHGTLKAERVNGFADAFRKIWHAEGIRGLWKGVGTSLAIGIPASSCYMLTYDHLVHVLIPLISPSPSVTPLISGVLARSFITSIGSPLELLRTNLQSTPLSFDKPNTLLSVSHNIRALVRSQGVLSLWRGLGPTLWRDVPFSGIYWAGYEASKAEFERRGYKGAPVAFASGSVSGMTAALLTSPFDVLKTRRQALLMNISPEGSATRSTTTSFSVLSQIVRTEGVTVLFAGLAPRMAKIAPACGIMIACYEGIGKFLMSPVSNEE